MADVTAWAQAAGLREAIDFIEENPALAHVYVSHFGHSDEVDMNYYLHINGRGTPAEQAVMAEAIMAAVEAEWSTEERDDGTIRHTAELGRLRFDVQVEPIALDGAA